MILQVENPVLEVHSLTVTYDKKPALWDVDFSIPPGSLAGVIGPNGAGKSTLVKAVMGLLQPDGGYVKLFGKDLDVVRDRVSYVPQRGSVDWDFPASVLDVALMGMYRRRGLFGRFSKSDREFAMQCLEKVRMGSFAHRQIAQLSGGQQQRVFLARALAQQADLYLMDEPFAGVDAATESAILELLLGMCGEGKTILVVHHDLQSAARFFDWVVLLNTRLVASGPKDKVFVSKLLQEAYGGQLTLLSQLGNLLGEKGFPAREAD